MTGLSQTCNYTQHSLYLEGMPLSDEAIKKGEAVLKGELDPTEYKKELIKKYSEKK